MKRFIQPVAVFLCGIMAAGVLPGRMAPVSSADRAPKKDGNIVMPYQWKVPRLPETMSFAGEKVPLDRREIREAFDRELLFNYYQQQNILYMLKLANRYFPMIEARLKANGVPEDFKYLCVAESNIQNLTSRAGAKGFWQFMPGTAPAYELEISNDVDERFHPGKSTDAACVYLKQAYRKFGSWTAAAASYNCGIGGYNAQAAFQGTRQYYDLMLPEETNRYIFRILSFKQLLGNPQQMGYALEEEDLYAPVDTREVKVTSSIPDLAVFARQQGTNYKMLKLLNPWLRSSKLAVKPGKTYVIELPE
ncbi:MAG TPA: lytic transglycosylase domain-containing protein [Chitinophagaceae bacterium]